MKNGLHAGLLYWFEFPHETNAFVSVGDAVGAGSEADGASVMAGVAHFCCTSWYRVLRICLVS